MQVIRQWGTLLPTFAFSLGLTVVLECLIARIWRLRGRDYLLVLLVNLLTNPAVVYLHLLFRSLLPGMLPLWQIPLEAAAVVVEGFCYARVPSIRRSWWLAVAANLFSYSCGLCLHTLL